MLDDDDDATMQLRESYAVERRFYDSEAYHRVIQAGLVIPNLVASDLDGSRSWPVACFVLNDLVQAGFDQHPIFLSVPQTKRALQWLATFHAIFWKDRGEQWQKELWERGGFWNAKSEAAPGGRHDKHIASNWVQTVRWLESKHPEVLTHRTKSIGQRIEALAGPLLKFFSEQTRGDYGTLIHGDYKAANLFLQAEPIAEEDAGSVVVVDFQYTGHGLGAKDVAYLLYPDAHGDFFEAESDTRGVSLRHLVDQLMMQFKGGLTSLSYKTFVTFYELVRVNLTHYWLSKDWVASTEGEARLVSALESTMDRVDGGSVLASSEEYIAVSCCCDCVPLTIFGNKAIQSYCSYMLI